MIGILAVILCAAFMLKGYLMKVAYGFRKNKKEICDKNSGRYLYQAILTIDGMMESDDAKRIENALEDIGGVQADADVFKRQIFVRMMREMDDNILCAAVKRLGPYTVRKIERSA